MATEAKLTIALLVEGGSDEQDTAVCSFLDELSEHEFPIETLYLYWYSRNETICERKFVSSHLRANAPAFKLVQLTADSRKRTVEQCRKFLSEPENVVLAGRETDEFCTKLLVTFADVDAFLVSPNRHWYAGAIGVDLAHAEFIELQSLSAEAFADALRQFRGRDRRKGGTEATRTAAE